MVQTIIALKFDFIDSLQICICMVLLDCLAESVCFLQELTPSGGVLRMKTRRLFLLNDLLIITVPR